jgi:hypothetical protein
VAVYTILFRRDAGPREGVSVEADGVNTVDGGAEVFLRLYIGEGDEDATQIGTTVAVVPWSQVAVVVSEAARVKAPKAQKEDGE